MRRFRSAALVLAIGLGVPVVAAAPAYAAPVITVSPNTALNGLDTVTVSGSGLTTDFAFFCQAVSHAVPGEASCGLPISSVPVTNGSFSSPYTVRRFIYEFDGAGRVDCLVTQCSILVDDFPDVCVLTPIAFATPASPPATRGTVTVTPTSAVEGDSVNVEGTGFQPNADVELLQCVANPVDTNDCGFDVTSQLGTDSEGDFSTTFEVRQTVTPAPFQGSLVDCNTPDVCVVAAMEWADIPNTIAFDDVQVHQAPSPDGRIRRRATGTIIGDDIYSASGGDQQFLKRQAAGTAYGFAVQLENDGDVAGDFKVTAAPIAGPVAVKYFVGYYDVTAAVTGGGFTFSGVPAGAIRKLGVRFALDGGAPSREVFDRDITFSSTGNPSRSDTVRVGVIVR